MPEYDYDLIVIGGGAGGFVASKLARGLGKKVAMIEKKKLGGECTLSGCIPSKAFIKASNVAYLTKNLKKYGLDSKTRIDINTDNVMNHVRSIVQKVYDSHQPDAFRKLGIDVLFGEPRFIDNHFIEVAGKKYSSRAFVISTGSSAFIPPIEGINTIPYMTNETFFDIDKLPPSMIVLGGGPVGIELAAALNRLGVKVWVIEMSDFILPREDKETVNILSEKLKEDGLNLLTKTKALRMGMSSGQIAVTVEDEYKQKREISADSILVAVGRRANVDGLNLEKAGVKYTTKGIDTNRKLQTAAPNIYACGDVTGPYQFSHMAEHQARIAAQNAVLPVKRKIDYRHVAWCIFTEPELAHAGLTEEEARELHGDKIRVYRYGFKNIDRAKTDVSETGMSKFILDPQGDLIGVHILGSHAGDIIHEAQLAKALGIHFHKLDSVIHIYPTFSDIIKQPAKLYHIERLQNNHFLRLLRVIFGRKKE